MRIFVALSLFAARAWGCTCAVSPVGDPPCQKAWAYEAVFTGTVEEVSADRLRKVRITISEPLNGVDPAQREIVIETGLGGGDCGYSFERGRKYIVYASKRAGGLATSICSPTRAIEDAEDDLKYFHGLAQASPTTELRVTAFDPQGPWSVDRVTALAGATITIDGPGVHRTVVTGASGRHVFGGLPPGQYKVTGSLEGYTTAYPLLPISAHGKGCAEVGVPLQLDRTISGCVIGPDGLPVSGVLVEAVPERPRQHNELPFAVDSATTDASGRYELRQLTSGDYYLGISLSRSPTLQAPYTRWFYPGTEDPQRAVLVHLLDKPGPQRFDLILPSAQHDRVIRGTVFWPDGRPAGNVGIYVEDPRWAWQTGSLVNVHSDGQGRFTVHVLDGTRYRIHAIRTAGELVSASPAAISPGETPLDLQLVLTQKGSSMERVSVSLEDWRKGLGLR